MVDGHPGGEVELAEQVQQATQRPDLRGAGVVVDRRQRGHTLGAHSRGRTHENQQSRGNTGGTHRDTRIDTRSA